MPTLLSPPKKEEQEMAVMEAPELPKVSWTRDAGLRKLYFYCAILCVASATTGFDGSMLNAMQFFPSWQSYFDNPAGSVSDKR